MKKTRKHHFVPGTTVRITAVPLVAQLAKGWKQCTKHRLPVPEILEGMAKTYRERNKVYGDNYKMVGRVMAALFPDGPPRLLNAEDYDVWHLFELQIVKLTRFAISGLTHEDSIHDLAVYGAMIEALIKEKQK